MTSDGLITLASRYSVQETLDKLEAALRAAAVTIFARIDHAAGAASVGLDLRPTELLIFGNPKGGTPLMQANQMIGLDLPLRALAWADAKGGVNVTYTDIAWLAARYHLDDSTADARDALTKVLAKFLAEAT
jgi:uncharacterized protein (DUF302 family)